MEISPYVNMGNFGEGRHLYLMLLIDARGNHYSYRIFANDKTQAVKTAEAILRYGVRIKEKVAVKV